MRKKGRDNNSTANDNQRQKKKRTVIDTLNELISEGNNVNFDMVFIDANKKDYDR